MKINLILILIELFLLISFLEESSISMNSVQLNFLLLYSTKHLFLFLRTNSYPKILTFLSSLLILYSIRNSFMLITLLDFIYIEEYQN